MKTLKFYFVGGTTMVWSDVNEETVTKFLEWLDDKNRTESYKGKFVNKNNQITCIRKELLLFADII